MLAEGLSRAGVSVFLGDVKGDLSGISQRGEAKDAFVSRAKSLGFDYKPDQFPVVFWDPFGEQGHPIRATISELGPLLLSHLMDLNETQQGVLNICFRVADEQGLLVLDLKDLRAMLGYISEHATELTSLYGKVSKTAIGTIQRQLRVAEMPGKAWIVATVVTMWASAACLADDLTGQPRVIDGDTIAVASRHVRLQGIDAPETDQVCLDAQGERWICGITARERLSSHIAGRAVTCASRGEDRYGRTLATCSADGENLNAWMVREGWALAYVQYSHEYLGEEAAAQAQRKGMWAGAFIAPWDWRHRDKRTASPPASGLTHGAREFPCGFNELSK